MTIKSILCIFNGVEEDELNAVNPALVLGKMYGAHVRFLHISPDPNAYINPYGEGIIVSADIIEAIKRENAARLKQAKREIVSLAAIHKIPLNDPQPEPGYVTAKFIHRTGHPEHIIPQEGRLSDLIIMGRGIVSANTLYDSNVVTALFSTGRPVMLIPNLKSSACEREHKTIAIAWKGTVEAARALHNAMPFLEKAQKVILLTVKGHGDNYDLEVEAILLEYLRIRGIHAQRIVIASGNRSPAETLLSKAKGLKIDLLVMGAYGHSRFREMLLGGVTNYMLEKADIPLLLSH